MSLDRIAVAFAAFVVGLIGGGRLIIWLIDRHEARIDAAAGEL